MRPPSTEAPSIETARLVLRAHRLDDFDACARMWADAQVTRFIGGRPSTEQESWSRLLRYAGHWALLGFGYWALEEKSSGRFAGELGFADFKRELTPSIRGTPELGWVLAPEAQGKGYATEALQAAIAWADARFSWPRTVCLIHPDNQASLRVAAKCGYREKLRTELHGAPTILFERLRAAVPVDQTLA
jgi:RimJ/RimL family protein N-acetyltransferase